MSEADGGVNEVASRADRHFGRGWRRAGVGGAVTVVALGFVAQLASSPGQSYWLSVFVDDLIVGTDTSRTGFSLLYALATVVSATVVVSLGQFAERRGTAVAWLIVSLGLAAGCGLLSVASAPVVALASLALLRAFGQGSFPLLATLLVARRFDRWRGRALAAANLGTTVAAAVLPAVAVALIAAFGWRGALQVTGLAVAFAVAPLALLARGDGAAVSRPDPERRRSAFSGLVHGFPWRAGGTTPLVVLSVPPLVVTAIVFHAVALLAPKGLDLGAVAAALGVLSLAGALGALVAGYAIDRWGVRVALASMSALLAVGTALLLTDSGVVAVLAFALVGVANGFNLIAAGAVWAKTYGIERLGLLQGAGDGARIAGAAIGPLPLAVAGSLSGSFAIGLIALSALSAAGLIASARWRVPVAPC